MTPALYDYVPVFDFKLFCNSVALRDKMTFQIASVKCRYVGELLNMEPNTFSKDVLDEIKRIIPLL